MATRFDKMLEKERTAAKQYDYAIGIDTGVNTAIAVWDIRRKLFIHVETTMIHRALLYIWQFMQKCEQQSASFYVRVEDARQRNWFGPRSQYKLQGAGSVKRDSKIWEDFLRDYHISFEMVAPQRQQGLTKMSAAAFKQLTHYTGRTTEHSRDAAMLVFGSNRTIPF